MTVYSDVRLHSERSSLEFGRMLRRWRVLNGWTQYTIRKWANEAGHSSSSHSGLSELERGLTRHPRSSWFINLAETNERLHQADFAGVTSRDLRDQLANGRAITHDDGSPWGAADFWSCHVGLLPPPAWLAAPPTNPAPELTDQAAADLCAAWAQQARKQVRLAGAASSDLIRAGGAATASARSKWLNVLLELDVYSPQELEELWDAEKSEWAPANWLNNWAASLQPAKRE